MIHLNYVLKNVQLKGHSTTKSDGWMGYHRCMKDELNVAFIKIVKRA